jgi:hypothetical protein
MVLKMSYPLSHTVVKKRKKKKMPIVWGLAGQFIFNFGPPTVKTKSINSYGKKDR